MAVSEELEQSVGDRIRHHRTRADMSRQALADRAAVSKATIEAIEQGARQPSTTTLTAIAAALDVTRGWLLDGPVQLTGDSPNTGAVRISEALTSVDDLIGDDAGVEPFDLTELREAVDRVVDGYGATRYQGLGEFLPGAIARTKAAVRQTRGDDRPAVLEAAARLFGMAGSTLVHLGHPDVAVSALRESIRLAEDAGAWLRTAQLRGTLAWVLLTMGRYGPARRLAVSTADQSRPGDGVDADLPAWALYGSLLLTAATAAAREGDRDQAHTLLADASRIAESTGRVTAWDDAWGPAGVLMQRVDVELVCDEYGAALELSGRMPDNPDLPLVSQCRHLSDVALAQTRTDRTSDALGSLLILERTSPEYLKVQDQPRSTVQELRAIAARPRELTELAHRIGLIGSPH